MIAGGSPGSTRGAVLLAVAVGLGFRLAFGLGYWVDQPLTHDEAEYLELAGNVAAGRGFAYDAQGVGGVPRERFGRAPVYPFFLAAAGLVTGGSLPLTAIKIAQAAVGALTIWIIAAIATRAAGARAGVLAAWGAALYPPLVWMPAYVLSETLYSALALANVLVADRALGTPRSSRSQRRTLLACGLLGGLCALTRPGHLFFLLLMGLYLLARWRFQAAVAFALGAILVVGPWTARNYREHGRFVLIASSGGINFWIGNHPLAIGDGDLAANPAIKRDNVRLRSEHPGLTPEELAAVYYREAVEGITADPLRWGSLVARKVFYLFVPVGPSYTLHSARYLGASLAAYGLLLPLAIGGAAVLAHRGRWPTALGLLIGSAILGGLVFFPQERYRLPVIDPAALVLAASGLALATSRRSPLPC